MNGGVLRGQRRTEGGKQRRQEGEHTWSGGPHLSSVCIRVYGVGGWNSETMSVNVNEQDCHIYNSYTGYLPIQ